MRLLGTNELFVNRHKIIRNIHNPNCFFFRSAVIDLFEGWREWLLSGSKDPTKIWDYTLYEISVRYAFKPEARLKARKLDEEIERIFSNDRIGVIDTDILLRTHEEDKADG